MLLVLAANPDLHKPAFKRHGLSYATWPQPQANNTRPAVSHEQVPSTRRGFQRRDPGGENHEKENRNGGRFICSACLYGRDPLKPRRSPRLGLGCWGRDCRCANTWRTLSPSSLWLLQRRLSVLRLWLLLSAISPSLLPRHYTTPIIAITGLRPSPLRSLRSPLPPLLNLIPSRRRKSFA